MVRRTALVLIALLLAGCGFQPRGGLQVPPDIGPLRVVSADPYDPVAAGLQRALQRAGAATDAADAGRLRLVRQNWSEGPLLTDDQARVREYVTRFRVDFELSGADGEVVMPRQTVELTREYAYDATAALGSTEEREVIREELRREMVAAILRRVDAALAAR